MLIRLCGHYQSNPNHIDKLISINGLPDEWFFRSSKYGGRELLSPWEPDVEANIPQSIRNLCNPIEVTKIFPPIEKGREPVIDKTTILGVRFNFMSQPGQEAWDKIERYIERMTPRDERIPLPVLVAPNHLSAFDPHAVRRTVRGSLEFYRSEIPHVDLMRPEPIFVPATVNRQPQPTVAVAATTTETVASIQAPQPLVTPSPVVYKCECGKPFGKEQGLRMHKMKAHPKQPAGV